MLAAASPARLEGNVRFDFTDFSSFSLGDDCGASEENIIVSSINYILVQHQTTDDLLEHCNSFAIFMRNGYGKSPSLKVSCRLRAFCETTIGRGPGREVRDTRVMRRDLKIKPSSITTFPKAQLLDRHFCRGGLIPLTRADQRMTQGLIQHRR